MLKLYEKFAHCLAIGPYSSFNTSSCAVTRYRSLEKHAICGDFSVGRSRIMNFLAYENRGDTERVKFWNGSHLKTRTGILQMVEVVSGGRMHPPQIKSARFPLSYPHCVLIKRNHASSIPPSLLLEQPYFA